MKKLFFLFTFICCTTISYAQWKPLGPNGGMLSTSNGGDYWPAIATDTAGSPYIVYTEGASYRLRVRKYDGVNWVDIGPPPSMFSGGYAAIYISPKDSIYIGYISVLDSLKPRVIKYNGTNWDSVGTPISYTGQLYETSIVVDTLGSIFFGFANFSSGGSAANIVTYDSTGWHSVGNTAFMKYSGRISLRINKNTNELYAGYNMVGANYASQVSKWSGSAWDTVGPKFTSMYNIDIASDGTLYMMHNGQVTVEKLVNNNWMPVGATNGIPGYTGIGLGDYGWHVKLDTANVPWVVYSEGINNAARVSIKKLVNGAWVQVGLHGFTATSAWDARLVFGKGIPYVVYNDGETKRKIYCMYYDAPLSVVTSYLSVKNIVCYPNPLHSNNLRLNSEDLPTGTYRLILYDNTGRPALQRMLTKWYEEDMINILLPVSLPNGVYFLQLSNATQQYNSQLLILR